MDLGNVRIHIVGAPSAGKSTLGRQLAHRYGCRYDDLDQIAFVDEHWTLRPMPERMDLVQRIMDEPGWIVEGGHLGWTQPLLAAADLIVWLDPPLHVLMRRHWTRHRYQGLRWLVRSGWGWQVRWYVQSYQGDLTPGRDATINRAATAVALEPWEHKTRRYRWSPGPEDLEQTLRDMRISGTCCPGAAGSRGKL